MTKHQLRTAMEQNLLPKLFFEHRAALIAKLLSEKEKFLAELYQNAAESNDETSPYTETDFEIHSFDLQGGYESVIITQPLPEESLECYFIVLCFRFGEEDILNLRYFTIEKATNSPLSDMIKGVDPEHPTLDMMLCEWTENHKHKNYGPISSDDEMRERINTILLNEK